MNALKDSGIKMGIAQDLAKKFISGEAVKIFGGNVTVQQLLQREQGEIFNPYMELLFNGPTLRAFKFSFKMMPRNNQEPALRDTRLVCFPCQPAPACAANGFSINGAVSTKTFTLSLERTAN